MGFKLCTTVFVCSDVASTKQLYRALKLFNTVSSHSQDCLMTYIYSMNYELYLLHYIYII